MWFEKLVDCSHDSNIMGDKIILQKTRGLQLLFNGHEKVESFAKTRETKCNSKSVIKCNTLKTQTNLERICGQ